MDNVIVRPCIDENGICFTDDNVKILSCTVSDNGNIKGITENNVKALYDYSNNTWYYGKEISKLNLVNLADRTIEERQKLGSIGGKKAKENRDAKKNFNELAKAMLEQTLTESQIKDILGDKTTMLLDNTVASTILGAMIQGALDGSFKCAEFVRDSAGYRPKDMLEVQADIMSDADRSLIDKALKSG